MISGFVQLGQLVRSLHVPQEVSFAEAVTDLEAIASIQDILEQELGDLVGLSQVTIDDSGTFQGTATERVGLGKTRSFRFSVGEDAISYQVVNPSADMSDEDFWEAVEFAAAKKVSTSKRAGMTLKCKPGNVQCGGKCQSELKKCNFEPSPAQKEQVKTAAAKVRKEKSKKEAKSKAEPEKAIAKEPEKSQPPKADSDAEKAIEKGDQIPTLSEAKKDMKLIGEGIAGVVYLDEKKDPPIAIKYNTNERPLDKDEMDNVRLASDLGIGPKLIAADIPGGKYSMEYLKGYETGLVPSSLPDGADTTPYNRSLLRSLKVAHDNNIKVGDLHEENIMVNPETQKIRFIDQGSLSRNATWQQKAEQLYDSFGDRPLAADAVRSLFTPSKNNKVPGVVKQEYQRMVRAFNRRDETALSEADYERMVNRTYELLDL